MYQQGVNMTKLLIKDYRVDRAPGARSGKYYSKSICLECSTEFEHNKYAKGNPRCKNLECVECLKYIPYRDRDTSGLSLAVLEPILNQTTKVLVKCKHCGNEYKAHPAVVFDPTNGGCSKCIAERVSTMVEGVRSRKHPIYNIWDGIKQRCYNKNSYAYKYYGDRGIAMSDLWVNDSYAFIQWALRNGWEKGLTIDRIESTKDYTPDNCRWVPMLDQIENKRMQYNNSTGYVGVHLNKALGKYEAYYSAGGKKVNCGYYDTAIEASEARVLALKAENIKYKRTGSKNEYL